jgi:hypothetical protein
MRFRTYGEIPYRGWTIQGTWRTSAERPGPDGFDRVAVKGESRIPQGINEPWDAFLRRLDELDGHRLPPASPMSYPRFMHHAPAPARASPKPKPKPKPQPSPRLFDF